MSYQEYEQLNREQAAAPAQENLPPTLSLEEAFGSVRPVSQPEDFAALREAAIEDHVDFEDALSVAQMKRQKISDLYSYDQGFDQVPGPTRH